MSRLNEIDITNTNIIKDINSNYNKINTINNKLEKTISDNNKLIDLIDKSYVKYIIDYIQLFEININKDCKFNRYTHKFEIFEEYVLDKKFTVAFIEISFNITIFYSNLD